MKQYHRNPRKITQKKFDTLTDTLDRLGDLGGIVHNLATDEIIGGNQRARVFGEASQVQIVEKLDAPDEQGTVAHGFIIWRGHRFAYRQVQWDDDIAAEANIRANIGAGDWDWSVIAGAWDTAELGSWGMDGDLLKQWNDDACNLREMLTAEAQEPVDAEPQIDRAEELQEKWNVQLGEIFKMGDHAIICGDCREPDTWTRLLGAAGVQKVNGVFTSPPYAEQRKAQYGGVPTDKYVEWWEAVQANVKANLAGDGSFFVNIKPHCEDGERVLYVFDLVLAMRRVWGWRFVDELCWVHQGIMGKWGNRFKNQFEPIYHFSASEKIVLNHQNVIREFSPKSDVSGMSVYNGLDNAPARSGSPFRQAGKKSALYDGALPGNVVYVNLGATSTDTGSFQAAAFPIALPDFFIRAYSDASDTWLDPFCGSGTTIVAAANNKRRGLGIELLPKYCAVICERMSSAFPDLVIERA